MCPVGIQRHDGRLVPYAAVQTGKGRQPMGKIAKKPLPPAAPAETEDPIWGDAMSDFFGFKPPRSLSADPAPAEPVKPAAPKPARKRAAAREA